MQGNRAILFRYVFQILKQWSRHLGKVASISVALCLPAILHGQTMAPLTLGQVQSLLKIGAPDPTIANEIKSRGVAFPTSVALLQKLRLEGAGVQTLAALQKLVPNGRTDAESGEESPPEGAFRAAAGDHDIEAPTLAVDRTVIARDLTDAQRMMDAGDMDDARQLGEKALELSPGSGQAEAILAEAAYQTGDAQTFSDMAPKAVRNGAAVSLRLLHLRAWPAFSLKPTKLSFSAQGVTFSDQSGERKPNLPTSLTYSKIVTVQVQRTPAGTLELLVKWNEGRHHRSAEFVADRSEVVKPQGGTQIIVSTHGSSVSGVPYARSPANAEQMLDGVRALFYHFN